MSAWDGEVFDVGEGSEESRGGYAGMGRCLPDWLFWGHRTQKDPARAQMTPALLHYYFNALHNANPVILILTSQIVLLDSESNWMRCSIACLD